MHNIFCKNKKISFWLARLMFLISPLLHDQIYLKLLYRIRLNKKLNLDNPSTFTEKMQWLKIYNRKSIYSRMVDKYLAKEIVSKKIGKEFIIPTIGMWDNANDINFEQLPNKFVLKTTHDSGGVYICKDKSHFDIKKIRKQINKSLKRSHFYHNREWPYKNVVPRVICEKYMVNKEDDELIDFKFYCFNGKPLYCQVIANRNTFETIDFYDREWRHMPFIGLLPNNSTIKNAKVGIPKPSNYAKMLDIASTLSKGLPFLRVDLYNINENIYFGEMTFYPASGLGNFYPTEWDSKLGDLINLSLLEYDI